MISCAREAPPSRLRALLGGGDPAGPTVTITAPADGFAFVDHVSVVATAADAAAPVVQAQLLANGIVQQTLTHEPWVFPWSPSTLPAGDYQLTVAATDASGSIGVSPPVQVTILAGATVSSLTVTPTSVAGGSFSTGTLTLAAPAAPGGQVVALGSSDAAIATVPATVTVAGGASSVAFSVAAVPRPAGATATVTLTAQYRGASSSAVLTVTTSPQPTFDSMTGPSGLTFVSVEGGRGTTASVVYSGVVPLSAAATVSLTSDNASVVVPPTVVVPAGQYSVQFPIATTQVAAPTTATITGVSSTGVTRRLEVDLYPGAIPASLRLDTTTVFPGQTTTATLTLSSTAPAGGLVLPIRGDFGLGAGFVIPDGYALSQFLTVPASVSIAEGQQVARFPVTATPLGGGRFPGIIVNAVLPFASAVLKVERGWPSGNALFDPVLQVPLCGQVGSSCDTGGLVSGRYFGGAYGEQNSPNTINASCPDGPIGSAANLSLGPVYHLYPSIDRIRVMTNDGSALAAGKTVTLEVTTWGAGRLDLYSAPNANSPSWTFVGSLTEAGIFQHVLSTAFTLPAGSLQAIRGIWTTAPTPQVCNTTGTGWPFEDHDDIVFATDNGGTPTNVAPAVNAGADQRVTSSPPATATLAGTVSDDGLPSVPAILTSHWSQVSGPGTVTFADATAVNTTATASAAGTYVLRLSATDGALWSSDDVTVTFVATASVNQAPVANAGADQTLTLPATTALLSGTLSDDGLPNPPGALVASWSKISGPASVAFTNPTAASTSVSLTVQGTYVLRLTVSDGDLTASDDVVVTVNPAPPPNLRPVVGAGPDLAITLPATASLVGTVTDDGLPSPPAAFTTTWSVVSGPGTVVFADASASITTASFTAPGTYVLRLTGNDGELSASDDVVVVVSPAPVNSPPVVNAGPDQAVNAGDSLSLRGSVTDDGLPNPPGGLTVAWSVVSGPGLVTFDSTTSVETAALFSVAGTYVVRMTVSDGELSGSDDVTVIVNPIVTPPVNHAPVVNAGPDQTGLPGNTVLLFGSVTDDGLPNPPGGLTVAWSVVSGPGLATFHSTASVETDVLFNIAGTYVVRLTVSDGELSGSDDVVITVEPFPNQPPAVDAGADQTVTLPSTAALSGTVIDDGLPVPPGAVTTAWTKVSGPGTVTFAVASARATTATFSLPGSYALRLTANDGALSASDDIAITVAAATVNRPPVVNAGPDQTVTLPAVANLAGTATDDGLPNPPGAVSVSWSKVSGPGSVTFVGRTTLGATASFSAAGSYVLRLTATDGALSATDDIAVTVRAAPVNRAPTVSAGADQTVTLPAAASLAGTTTDDGLPNPPAATTTTWSKVSGPGTVTFGSASARSTTATFSAAGTYLLRLTASDGALSASDDIAVTVRAAPVNRAPTVNAGADQSVTLPSNASLAGTVTDDGLPNPPAATTTTWSKVSGPGTVTFGSASARSTTATFSAAGTYVLRLTATDGALSASDDIAVTVAAAPTLKVQYRISETAVNDNQIKPHFNIVNNGATAVPLSELKIRYWYTVDTQQAQAAFCDFAAVGCSRITETFTTVSPVRTNADRYLEVGFTSAAGSLAAHAQSGEIQLRFNKVNFSNFNEANDYSYSSGPTIAAPTSLIDWTRVTLYRNATRIWGVEP